MVMPTSIGVIWNIQYMVGPISNGWPYDWVPLIVNSRILKSGTQEVPLLIAQIQREENKCTMDTPNHPRND